MAAHRPRHIFEYFVLRTVSVSLTHAPYGLTLLVAWIVAWVGFYLFRYRVKVAEQRIRDVFGDRFNGAGIRRIAWKSWRDFMFNVFDMFRLHLIDRRWIERRVVNHDQAREVIQRHCSTGRGAIIASPHMGASEMASVVMQRFDVPIFLITGKQKNPLTDALINRMRRKTEIPTLQRGAALLKSVFKRLRGGGVLAFLPDVRVAPKGMLVRFLDREASVAPGMAMFAKQTEVPIFPLIVTRVGWTRHHLQFHDPIYPDPAVEKEEDRQRMTQEVFTVIERAIREAPEQWFWFNKRWILDPP